MARQLRVVNTPSNHHERAPDLRVSVKAALAEMTWLDKTDEALKALALRQAEEIETAIDRAQLLSDAWEESYNSELRDARSSFYKRLELLEAQCDVVKAVSLIGPQLAAVLKELGGSPGSRKALKPDNPVGGRLAALRAANKIA